MVSFVAKNEPTLARVYASSLTLVSRLDRWAATRDVMHRAVARRRRCAHLPRSLLLPAPSNRDGYGRTKNGGCGKRAGLRRSSGRGKLDGATWFGAACQQPVIWLKAMRHHLSSIFAGVRRQDGFSLRDIQCGGRAGSARPCLSCCGLTCLLPAPAWVIFDRC